MRREQVPLINETNAIVWLILRQEEVLLLRNNKA
jgi:hypothetical protein